jgi:spore coat protein U-like protein
VKEGHVQRLLLVTALAAAAISLPAAATSAPNVTLIGVVGPEMTITLRNGDGSAVTHLDPGSYDVSVDDRSILHNFHLLGPGVEQRTDVETVGMASWTVELTDGNTYTFQCDAHVTTMKGTFTVGNIPPPPPPTPKLNGKVTATTISLKSASGSKVRSLAAGKYKVAVNDSAKKQNFHLSGPGINKKTGVQARTKTTWTIALNAGKYTYRSDKNRRLRGTFTVR